MAGSVSVSHSVILHHCDTRFLESEPPFCHPPGRIFVLTLGIFSCSIFFSFSCSVVSDSATPWTVSPPGSSVHGDSPGKHTGVGCHILLQAGACELLITAH